MNRLPGHYWCKYKGEWTVAYWSSCWELPGLYTSKEDEDFSEIDERRIERQLPELPKTHSTSTQGRY